MRLLPIKNKVKVLPRRSIVIGASVAIHLRRFLAREFASKHMLGIILVARVPLARRHPTRQKTVNRQRSVQHAGSSKYPSGWPRNGLAMISQRLPHMFDNLWAPRGAGAKTYQHLSDPEVRN